MVFAGQNIGNICYRERKSNVIYFFHFKIIQAFWQKNTIYIWCKWWSQEFMQMHIHCMVRKHMERSTNKMKLVVARYDGIREHLPSPEHINKSSSSSMSQDPTNQTLSLSMLPASFAAFQIFSSSLDPQTDKDQSGRSQDPSNRTPQLGSPTLFSSASQLFHSPNWIWCNTIWMDSLSCQDSRLTRTMVLSSGRQRAWATKAGGPVCFKKKSLVISLMFL